MDTEQQPRPIKDGRLDLLERLKANAQFTRTSRKTDPLTAQFASQMEQYFDQQRQLLSSKTVAA